MEKQSLIKVIDFAIESVNRKPDIEDFYEWLTNEIDENIDPDNPSRKCEIPYSLRHCDLYEKVSQLLISKGFKSSPGEKGRKFYFTNSRNEYVYSTFLYQATNIYINFKDE